MYNNLRQSGGSTERQKGIAAQLRTFVHGNLRDELNSIVHSGDSHFLKSSHPSNDYIDLSNNYDSKAENVLKEAIDYIKNNDKIGYKQKMKILKGVVQLNTITSPSKQPTTVNTMRVTPRKTFKDITSTNTMTRTRNLPRTSRRSRTRTRTRTSRRSRSRSRTRSRTSRRSRT